MPPRPSDTHDGVRRPRKPKAARPAKPVPAKPAKPLPAKPAKPLPAKPVAPRRKAARPAKAPRPAKAVEPAQAAKPAPDAAAARGGGKAPRRAAAAPDPLLGRTIARCRLEALIGLGRTARVYRAHYEALDQVVAVKILRDEVAATPVLVQRFESEARAIAKVDNENVLKIYDVGATDDGLHYMVVELLEGEEVLDLITREERIEPMDAMRIVRQAASGLAAAHGLGLVHRDVKPQNLFLLEDGTVKVVDFGLAASIEGETERVGTPHYMAPEVCESGAAEPASDIYGLGIVLYHLLVGRPPYAGKDVKQILHAHIDGKPLRPELDAPGTPKAVGDIVRALTKRDPLLRPTALEVVEQLDAVGGKELKQKESLGRRRRRSSRARSAVNRRARAEAKKGTPVVALALVGVVVVGGIVALVGSGGGDEPPASRTPGEGGAATAAADAGTPAGEAPAAIAPKREETEEEKAARLATKAAAEQEKEAREALQRVEQWARENWRSTADTEAVVTKYRYVRTRYKDSTAGEEAKRRVRAILKKELHPHPDREWTSAETLADARETWKRTEPEVVALVKAFEYGKAQEKLPPAIPDESGSYARDVGFWREYVRHLVEFRRAAARAITNASPDDRMIETPDGEGRIRRVNENEFEVFLDGKARTYTWKALGAQAIESLVIDLFSGDADKLILLMAFTYAHELDAFWDVDLELGATTGMRTHADMMRLYQERFRERAGK